MSKHGEEPNDDGFIKVRRGKGAKKPLIMKPSPSTIDRRATLESVTADFEKRSKIWKSSSCRREVRQILDRQKPDDGWALSKAVCLGTGSFHRDNMDCRKRSMFQLAAFVDIVRLLQLTSPKPIELFAQDPFYTDLDMEFLCSLNVHVLEADFNEYVTANSLQLANEHVGPESVVFEFFTDAGPVFLRELTLSNSRLYICSSLRGRMSPDNVVESDPDKPNLDVSSKRTLNGEEEVRVVKKFYETHEWMHFPEFEEDRHIFLGLAFHWKALAEEEDDNLPELDKLVTDGSVKSRTKSKQASKD